MNYDYRIANKRIRFDAEYPLISNWEAELFSDDFQEEALNLVCRVSGVDELPRVKGRLLLHTIERNIYLQDESVYQELLNRKNNQPLFLSEYAVDGGNDVKLWALNQEQPYTARMEHIWAAIDFPYQMLQEEVLIMHSAVIQVRDEAVLFLAPSGTGKSTQAKLWHETRGAIQLNGDKTAIGIENEKIIAYGLPFSGTSKICMNYRLPVRALVVLSQGKENQVNVLTGVNAMSSILNNCFGHSQVPGCMAKIYSVLWQVLSKVKVYTFDCTPDERAVYALEKELWKE